MNTILLNNYFPDPISIFLTLYTKSAAVYPLLSSVSILMILSTEKAEFQWPDFFDNYYYPGLDGVVPIVSSVVAPPYIRIRTG